MSGIALLFAAAFAGLVLPLVWILRRERLRGPASTTHPFLIGLYRGLAFVVVAFAAFMVIGALYSAFVLSPSLY